MNRTRSSLLRDVADALLSGLLLGCAFPPVAWHLLIWIGFVPLLWAMNRCPRLRDVYWLGAIAGFVFFLITLHPLVSAYSWIGWAQESETDYRVRMMWQWWFTHALWAFFACWGAIFWGAWAALTKRLAADRPWRLALLAPSLWILIPEWLRAKTTFDVTWSFFGYATVHEPALRQLAAVGGVFVLSALIVLVNVAVAQLIDRTKPRRWLLPVVVSGLLLLAWQWGASTLRCPLKASPSVPVAVLQHHKDEYTTKDFTAWGFDHNYLPLIRNALEHHVHLIVIPETVIVGAVSLDGTASYIKAPDFQFPHELWDAQIQPWLSGSGATFVISLDTVEHEEDHSTVIAWTEHGIAGTYHKRRLVPFSEYAPWGLHRWLLHGRSQYSPGAGSQVIHVNGLALGGFICQEVVLPQLTRDSVRDGATVLITGGNDGVFVDPVVARVNAQMAQLRAVETGRFLLRAMKTGISAIIDPHGTEIARSHFDEPVTLFGTISPQQTLTPYVKYGDWILWLSALIIGAMIVTNLRIASTQDHSRHRRIGRRR